MFRKSRLEREAQAAAPPSSGARALILSANFYPALSDALEADAIARLRAAGASVEVHRVPGALELPLALEFAAAGGGVSLWVALGVVIRGETSHYDLVCGETTRGLYAVARARGLSLGFGLVTVETLAQAEARVAPDGTHRVGSRAAEAALALARLRQDFSARDFVRHKASAAAEVAAAAAGRRGGAQV